ncbi:MAG: hypothetical protein IH861_02460 [Chloroflexi bacterium]|nr:hypothetical protein [Chloroflexota bacterium]
MAKAHRMTLELNEETYQKLLKLAKKNGKSMTDVVREGIALRNFADEEKDKGKSLAIVDGDVIETKILLT